MAGGKSLSDVAGGNSVADMGGLLVAAATDLSPSLWRKQYGYWTAEGG